MGLWFQRDKESIMAGKRGNKQLTWQLEQKLSAHISNHERYVALRPQNMPPGTYFLQ